MNRMLVAMLFLFPLLVAACGGEQFGAGIDRAVPEVSVQDVFLKPALQGQKVTLAGKISTQCQSSGCWFVLQDESGQIFVDLASNNFALPAMPGRTVKASGTVATREGEFFLMAEGVEAL